MFNTLRIANENSGNNKKKNVLLKSYCETTTTTTTTTTITTTAKEPGIYNIEKKTYRKNMANKNEQWRVGLSFFSHSISRRSICLPVCLRKKTIFFSFVSYCKKKTLQFFYIFGFMFCVCVYCRH